jgi:hypothetical protein
MSTADKTMPADAARPKPDGKTIVAWFLAGATMGPVAILLHELGHHLTALAFGFQGATLHYMSANYALEQEIIEFMLRGDRADAAAVYPLWQIAVNALAGPAVGYFLILPVCLLAAKIRPNAFFIALGTMPFFRALPEMLSALADPGMLDDENTAAFALGLPPNLLHAAGLLISLAGAAWLVRRIPAEVRWTAVGSLVIGGFAGLILYAGFLGPWLLP